MKLFIGTTSKENIDKTYTEDSKNLIKELATIDNIELIYGAWNKGLLGFAYQEFAKNNRKITGVITTYHKENDLKEKLCDEEITVSTTTERFEKIYQNSDILLFLPGGIGTLSEILSAIEEQRIQNQKKKIILYNTGYFYTPLLEELYRLYKLGFIEEHPTDYITIESQKEEIIKLIKEEKQKWKI